MNKVTVRWHDGYLEEFDSEEIRFGSDLLWMRLTDGKNRHIPLRSVRWFGLSQESHQSEVSQDATWEIFSSADGSTACTKFRCSKCGTTSSEYYHYCPKCGSRMWWKSYSEGSKNE